MQFALMYLAAHQPEHDAGAADRISRPGDPAAHVDDRGRRRDPDHRRRELLPCGSGSTRVQLAARGVTATDVLDGDQRLELPLGARQDRERIRRATRSRCRRRCRRRRPSARCRCSARRRRGGAAARRGARSSSAPRATDTIVTFNGAAGHLHRRLPDSGGQPARHRGGGGGRAAERSTTRLPEGMTIELVYDCHRDDQRLDRGGVQDHRRGGGDRRGRDPALPRLVPLGADADRDHPAVADRRLLRPAGARLFDQPPVAARHGARHRPRRRRRDRGGGEHPPPHRGGADADGRGDRRHEGDHRAGRSP